MQSVEYNVLFHAIKKLLKTHCWKSKQCEKISDMEKESQGIDTKKAATKSSVPPKI